MSDALTYIDNYFRGTGSREEMNEFERRIREDPSFAKEVAFYVATMNVLKEESMLEKKERFKQLVPAPKPGMVRPIRKLWAYVSAAAVVMAVVLGVYLFGSSPSPQQLADRYIKDKLTSLSVSMGPEDSLEKGKNLYNIGKFNEALQQFENILQSDPSNFEAKEFAGIVYLRLDQYDKALAYFQQLEKDSVYANPATFYRALTLMKRNLPGDKEMAKQLLRLVEQNDLEGREMAHEWLKKL